MTAAARTFTDLIEQARAVLIELDLARRGVQLKRQGGELVGPCPRCGGRDRFGISLRKQLFICRGAAGGDVIAMVQHLDQCSFTVAVERLTGEFWPIAGPAARAIPALAKPKTEEYERQQHAKAARLWQHRRPIAGSIGETYLRSRRGITCQLPATLGYLAPTKPGHHPALIAALDLAEEIEPGRLATTPRVESVHLTLLRPDGSGKADVDPNKIMVGGSLRLPIVLAPLNDLFGLAICEGIENGLTVHQATGLGVWAAASAGHMPALADTIPRDAEAITIYADDDKAGRKGALDLAEALHMRRRRPGGFIRGEIEILIEGLS
jgi:phage/plasmid primase-like uncharacterized protein